MCKVLSEIPPLLCYVYCYCFWLLTCISTTAKNWSMGIMLQERITAVNTNLFVEFFYRVVCLWNQWVDILLCNPGKARGRRSPPGRRSLPISAPNLTPSLRLGRVTSQSPRGPFGWHACMHSYNRTKWQQYIIKLISSFRMQVILRRKMPNYCNTIEFWVDSRITVPRNVLGGKEEAAAVVIMPSIHHRQTQASSPVCKHVRLVAITCTYRCHL